MSGFLGIFASPWIDRLGWVLLHFIWQGALIGLIVLLAGLFLKRASPNFRYCFLCAALLGCGLSPLITWNYLLRTETITSSGLTLEPSNREETSAHLHAIPRSVESISKFYDDADLKSPLSFLAPDLPKRTSVTLNGITPAVVALWFLGLACLCTRLLGSWLYIRQLVRSGFPIQNPFWVSRLQDLSHQMQVGPTVRLLQSALIEVPTLVGWLRPVILVPSALFAGLPPDQLEAIFVHELAHIRRFDYLVNLFQVLIETLLFYHPVVWWIGACLRQERENCCDDFALSVIQDRVVYANALTALEEMRSEQLSLTVAASHGSLLQRIHRIAHSDGDDHGSSNSRPVLSIVAVTLFLIFFLSSWLWQIHENALTDRQLFMTLLQDNGWKRLNFAQEVSRHKERLNYARNSDGLTLLDVAAKAGLENEALLLLTSGADPNLLDAVGLTPIFYTLSRPSYSQDMIRDFLLLRGAGLNVFDQAGDTPLMVAAKTGDLKSIRILLRQGAQLHPSKVSENRQPAEIARNRGDAVILDYLQNYDSQPNYEPQHGGAAPASKSEQDIFTDAAYAGDLRMMESLLAQGADINGRDSKGNTALLRAISHQQQDAVVYLLLLGADPNLPSPGSSPPLAWTFGWFGSTSDYMRMALIADNARTDVNMKDGNSLLAYACLRENEHAAQWMIWSGVDPSKPCPNGTPMHLASTLGLDRVVELLQRNGVSEKAYSDPSPKWQMMHAVKAGNFKKVLDLLAAGAPVNLPLDESDDNGLMVAVKYRRIDVARLLLEKGANPNYQNTSGDTVLHISVGWRFQEMEEFREELLQTGANPNLANKNGTTPFIEACKNGDLAPKITQMVAHGANINLRDKNGHSALYYAQKSGHSEAMDYLLQLNATQ